MHGFFKTKYLSTLIWNLPCSCTPNYGNQRFILNCWFCVFIYRAFLVAYFVQMQKGVFFVFDK
jgi:hypothetical protein